MTVFERTCCPVCHGRSIGDFHHPAAGDTWEVKRCEACDFVFVANPPEVDFAAAHFPWEETLVNEKVRRDREHAPAAVIIKVPNHASINRLIRGRDWCGYRFPDHVNYFEPEHLEHLLEQANLKTVRFGLRDRFPTSDNMWCVACCR